MKVLINLYGLSGKAELHKLVRVLLPLPEYYGNNLDALKDALCEIDKPTEIAVVGIDDVRSDMEKYAESFIRVLCDAACENPYLTIRKNTDED